MSTVDINPPSYESLKGTFQPLPPIPDALKDEHTTEDQKVEVTVFQTEVVAKDAPEGTEPRNWGSLEIGTKSPMGVLYHHVTYRPPPGKDRKPEAHDISGCIQVLSSKAGDPPESLHYVKLIDAVNSCSHYSFDIFVNGLGTETATFQGTITSSDNKVYNWSGYWLANTVRTVTCTTIKVDNLEGDEKRELQELHEMTPLAAKGDGARLNAGDDAAQKYGDEMMERIMFYALDEKTKEEFMPNLNPLSSTEQSILSGSPDYFKKAAIHVLCRRLRGTPELDKTITSKIVDKADAFFRMMSADDKYDNDKDDPVVQYGWNRATHGEELKTLQGQYTQATTRCYEEGFKKYCPLWEKVFLKSPAKWFKAYSAWLVSPEHTAAWLPTVVHRAEKSLSHAEEKDELTRMREENKKLKEEMAKLKGTALNEKDAQPDEKEATLDKPPVQKEVLLWGTKLSLLKHAAGDAGKDLKVEPVTSYLSGIASMPLLYAQLVQDDLIQHSANIAQILEGKHKEDYKSHLKEQYHAILTATTDAAVLLQRVVHEAPSAMSIAKSYWSNRLPPFEYAAAAEKLTIGQLMGAAPHIPEEHLVPLFDDINIPVGPLVPQIEQVPGQFSTVELGGMIASITSEVLTVGGWLVGRGFAYVMGQRYIISNARAWLTGTKIRSQGILRSIGNELVGNLSKVLRIVGLVGCIFNITASYFDMQKENVDPAFHTYSKLQFWLGVAEGGLIVADIIVSMLGCTGWLLLCGPLAVVAGAISLVAAVVYFAFFKPDPNADIKTFLNGEPKSMGLYDVHP